jgi:hypothetical protein
MQLPVAATTADSIPRQATDDPQRERQAQLRGLQECVCELLIKNQQLRMALREQTAKDLRIAMAEMHKELRRFR